MPSSSRCCATGVFVLPSLLLLPLFLSLFFGVQGATLREHRLSGIEPVSYGPASQIHPPPSAEMLRALRYIQSLSQRTPSDTLADEHQSDQEEDDMESIRSMLQLAAPGRMDREEERDNTQELLQAVLKTLQQTEEHMVPQKTPQRVIATQPRYAIHPFPRPKQKLEVETSAENYGRTSWANPDSRRRHRQYPIMFDDEEDQEQPLKRTNENAEEEYTPQKLATLQSVFEELRGISASKDNSKRDDGEEDDDEEDDDSLYRQRKMALENIMETDDWAPLEEQTETEEEERERHGFNRDLEDEDQEEEEEEEEEEDDDDDDDVKRSNQPTWFQRGKEEDPEDIAKLVDYYLLRVLEKKEQEQQKRQEANRSEQESNQEIEKKDVEEDEDEEKEEREIKPLHNTVPVSVSQIIKISQQLRITPEEVLDLLQNEKHKDLSATLAQSHTPYATTHNAHKTFTAAPHRRPLETSEGDSLARDILSILELVNAVQQNDKRPAQPNTSRYYEKETSKDDYDNTPGEEDELAGYLASEMLAHGQRRARLMPLREVDQPLYGNLERAIQNYFDKSTPEKRTAEHENAANGLDNNTMLKILRYLEPESDNIDETDSEGKTVPEM